MGYSMEAGEEGLIHLLANECTKVGRYSNNNNNYPNIYTG